MRRPYQNAVLKAIPKRRFFSLLWRRQGGKSTTLSEASVGVMMANAGITVTYASASLLLGREIIFKEAQLISGIFRKLGKGMEILDTKTKKQVTLDPDALADLFESQRMEFRVHHDRTTFSRTQVIAPNPATARGWTGWVLLDEFGFIRDFQDLWEGVEPIVSTDPDFHLIMATTPPKDDSHYSYELTAPPAGTIFDVNPEGNWYESEARVPVHRLDIHDAYAAGVKLYDLRTGKEVTPDQHFASADDKDAWRRNYRVEHVLGGTSAVGLMILDTAQRRGIGKCACIVCDSDLDFDRALNWITEHCGSGPIGIGFDVATTEKGLSNPSVVSVVEQIGVEYSVLAVIVWKTTDPAVAEERVKQIIQAVISRKSGGRPKALSIDATNERYFAARLKDQLSPILPVHLVVGSEEAVQSTHEPMNMKQYLGSRLVGALEDNRMTLPPERYLKEDFRLVKRDRGQFVCIPDSQGRHGDTFDGTKLALNSLESPEARPPIVFRTQSSDRAVF